MVDFGESEKPNARPVTSRAPHLQGRYSTSQRQSLSMLRQLGVGVVDGNRSARRFLVLALQPLHHRLASIDKPLERPGAVARESVRRKQRQSHRRIQIAYDRIRQSVGIYLPPAYGFGGGRPGESAGVGTRVRDLEEIIVSFLIDSEHFLNLRLCLEHEILRAAAAENQHCALS